MSSGVATPLLHSEPFQKFLDPLLLKEDGVVRVDSVEDTCILLYMCISMALTITCI